MFNRDSYYNETQIYSSKTVKCPGQELNLNFNYLGCVIPLDHQDWNETDFEN